MLLTEAVKDDDDGRKPARRQVKMAPAPVSARARRKAQRGLNVDAAKSRTQDALARRASAAPSCEKHDDAAPAAARAAYPREVEHGNREYKLELASCSVERLARLTSQLKWRLAEGGGEAVYLLGVEDDGTPLGISPRELGASLKKLRGMAATLDAELARVTTLPGRAAGGQTAEVLVRRRRAPAAAAEARVLVLGASGGGKTTLVGVLKTDETDDGAGLARLHVLKHQHELDRGLTSTVSCHTLRFDAHGAPMLDSDSDQDVPAGIFTDCGGGGGGEQARDLVTLVDTAGHPRFFKSVVYGMTAMAPDAALLVVDARTLLVVAAHNSSSGGGGAEASAAGADGGMFACAAEAQRVRTTLDLLRVCRAVGLRFTVVVSKADQLPADAPPTQALVRIMLAAARDCELDDDGAHHAEAVAHADLDADMDSDSDEDEEEPEVLVCSSTSKQGVPELRAFLGQLSRRLAARARPPAQRRPARLFVREAFDILGFDGAIVGGVLESGRVALGDALVLGPGPAGRFFPVRVRSIRMAHGLDVAAVSAGASATFGVCLDAESGLGAAHGADHHADAVFKKVVRRGACLAHADGATPAALSLQLRVRACLDVSVGSVQRHVHVGKAQQFTLRCRTVKQRVTCEELTHAEAEAGSAMRVRVTFVERPESVPTGTTVVLQRGSLVLFAERE